MADRLNEMFPQIIASIRQIENSGSVLELFLSITDMFPAHLALRFSWTSRPRGGGDDLAGVQTGQAENQCGQRAVKLEDIFELTNMAGGVPPKDLWVTNQGQVQTENQ